MNVVDRLVATGCTDLAERIEAVYTEKKETRVYTVTSFNKPFLAELDKFFKVVETLGSWGASRTVKFSVDGDGNEQLQVKELKGRDLDRSFHDLIDKDEFYAHDAEWKA